MIHPAVAVHQLSRGQQPPNSSGNRMPHSQMPMRMPQPRIMQQTHAHLLMGLQGQTTGVMVPVAAPLVATPVVQMAEEMRAPVTLTISQQGASGAELSTEAVEFRGSSGDAAAGTGATAILLPNLANTKEKTPMCLINELARFNKITHQYRLTSETGPAHKKQFTVTLLLGTEEYTAEGASIKKAQHAAAADALVKTCFEHPPPKTQRVLKVHKANVTPTVELNALAMKRGEPTSYTLLEPLPAAFPPVYHRPLPFQRFHYNKQPVYPMAPPPVFYVTLKVGDREFSGQGKTAQTAKHDAAAKALLELKALPMPESSSQENGQGKDSDDDECNLKSPISQVHEMALKRNLAVTFEVIKERGPPHMRTFLTCCKVGDIQTEGEGNSKKTSKKKSAENMMEELRKLPPLSPPEMVLPLKLKKKQPLVKKKTRNLIKVAQEPKGKQEGVEELNPISRLIQIQQAKKEKEPEYTLVEDRNNSKKRQFAVMVTVGELFCTGYGPNKKMAKRSAAEGLLKLLNQGPVESKDQQNKKDKTRKVKFQDEALVESKELASQPGGSSGRQLVPGLLLMTDSTAANGQPASNSSKGASDPVCQTTALIAKELLNSGSSPTAKALVTAGKIIGQAQGASEQPTPVEAPPVAEDNSVEPDAADAAALAAGQAAKPKELLSYLAKLLKFTVQYTDFPKVNQSEFLSLVTLTTTPTQTHHGSGNTIEAAQERAAHTALRALSEYGFNTATLNLKEEKSDN